tara:strand:- start:943 stop:1899 length:957 start_codon:yes stop_codon:yes gene_type:complete
MQKKTVQLSLDEIHKLSLSLKNLLQLSITGGEPSLRKDLPEVVEIFCKNSNVAKCSIITNGFLTDRIIKMAREILSKNKETSFRFAVSLDGSKEVHNKIRGIDKSYDNAVITLNNLKELKKEFNNLHVDINTCVSKYNYIDFLDFHNFVDKNFDPDHHTVTMTRGITKESDANDIPIEFVEKIYRIIKNREKKFSDIEHKLIKSMRTIMYEEIERIFKEKKFKYYCTAGKKYLTIYQDGNVSACEILSTIHPNQSSNMGNLKDYNFDCGKLLNNSVSNERREWIKNNKCFCTFECAKSNDIVFNPSLAIKTIAKSIIS